MKEKICQDIEIFNSSSRITNPNVWSLHVKDCVLPNQDYPCSFTQYVTYDHEYQQYLLVYPDFTDEDKVEQGDGDATENETLRSYLLRKAEKQTEDMSLP